jgi:hypothetical protein
MPESAAPRRALRTDARRQLMERQLDFLGFTFGLRATLGWRKPDSNSSELMKPIDLRIAEELLR